ncbi:MAG: ribonuclease HI family protein [Nitrososphaeria archaeon]|nr:ribonuclease HI family protein [Nitrososphaeria archaeon]
MIEVYVDGLCEPINPNGIAAYGFVIYMNGKRVLEGYGVVGKGEGMSNNVGEYAALCEAIKALVKLKLTEEEILVKSDSKLLVNQMNGVWRCHNGYYIQKYNEAKDLIKLFKNISFIWIPREENKQADSLSRKGYEEYIYSNKVQHLQ